MDLGESYTIEYIFSIMFSALNDEEALICELAREITGQNIGI